MRLEAASSLFDLLSAALQELNCLGLEYRDGSAPDRVRICAYFAPGTHAGSVVERLQPWVRMLARQPECSTVLDQDWNALWRSTYRPVPIGERLVILPSWSRRRFADRIAVKIRPEQAFGTGSHETTRLCLEALEQAPLEGRCVADVGTGSGVLAIAAARLGAALVHACDPDPLAIANARHNLRLNGVGDRIVLREGDLSVLPRGAFDWVVANLVLEPLREGMTHLASCLRPGGHLILSGLVRGQDAELLPLAQGAGLSLRERRVDSDWVLLHLEPEGNARDPQGESPASLEPWSNL